jgi:hypothetical protein
MQQKGCFGTNRGLMSILLNNVKVDVDAYDRLRQHIAEKNAIEVGYLPVECFLKNYK